MHIFLLIKQLCCLTFLLNQRLTVMRTGLTSSRHKKGMKNKSSNQRVLETVWLKILDVPNFLSACFDLCTIKKMLVPRYFNKHLFEVK